MQISIKNLKGEIFTVEADGTDQVAALKDKIQSARADLPADRQKLIHAGKVLKDEQTVAELGLSSADFIVCMVTKEVTKKPAVANSVAPSAATAPTSVSSSAAPAAPTPSTPVTASGDARAVPPAPARVVSAPSVTTGSAFVTPEAVQSLVNMGFPEADSRSALAMAMGNPDLACDLLLGGGAGVSSVPVHNATPPSVPVASNEGSGSSSVTIDTLRQHPQFESLKQLVQENPSAIPQVLDLISQQSPALYAAIQANNDAFIAMMNEPLADSTSASQPTNNFGSSSGFDGGFDDSGMMADPAQLVQMLTSLPAAQRAQLAQRMGMNPQQLEQLLQMPPEILAQVFGQVGGVGRDRPGVIRLTEEEMAAVQRLMELGFSREEAAQAYLACDKNEELAANMLLSGGWDDDMMQDDYGAGDHDHDDQDDDMYG